MKKNFLHIILCLFFSISYSQSDISFVQKDKSKIEISFKNKIGTSDEEYEQAVEIKNIRTGKTQIINNIEVSITGKPSHLEINDYNFDGFTDFASYHTDDGMGVYTIYQIFVFNPITKQFDSLQFPSNFSPKCEMFCDVKVDKIKKTLTSSCRGGARTHSDVWKYDKNKKLILSKTESF
ncbi:XAC2610-related protein [Flavobacterium notoginsengisoli]|uniref:XAC2610-related protein n=1 Tax=Flavobacterium notoginsengisoli TaxID=1478199 RepID=UPI00364570E4